MRSALGNRITDDRSSDPADWACWDLVHETPVTEWLRSWQEGSGAAAGRVFEALYSQLRRIAIRERSVERQSSTLQATELIHELYLRMARGGVPEWTDRGHFLAVATLVMRRVLVDRARRRLSSKRGGPGFWSFEGDQPSIADPDSRLVALDHALKDLERVDPIASEFVQLRYFGGLSLEQTAEVLGIGRATAVRRWRSARAWLRGAIEPDERADS